MLWAREYLGVQMWAKQRELLRSLVTNRNTAVAAGHGVGKSWSAAIAVAWWVDVHPVDETFVATTAPSAEQVNIIWDNVRRVHGLAKQRFEDGLVDHPLPGYITGDNKWKLANGTILGQGRKPPDAKSDVAFQGRHATYLLAIGDEAVGISPGFLEALGNIATAEHNRQLLLANPTDPSSAMAKIWVNELASWHRMHISVFDSPKITPDPEFDVDKAPALSGMEYIEQALETFGSEDDPRYVARVLGQWAFDAGNTVFTAEELARAKRTVVVPDPFWRREAGVDVARMGSDSSIVYVRERGEVWEVDPETDKPVRGTGVEGVRIRLHSKWSKAPLVGANPENPGTANRLDTILREELLAVAKVDASGIGSAVVDGLADLNGDAAYQVIEVFGGAQPSDGRAYVNLRAETIFDLKRDMAAGVVDLDPGDETLFNELEGIQFEITERGPLKIESKETIRRSGRKSPDHADGLWYAYLDVDALLDDPYAGLERGERVSIDPYQYASAAGMPM